MMYAPVVQSVDKRTQFLVWGSVLRMLGSIIVGFALIWLGLLIGNPLGFLNPLNPLGGFQTIGTIIVLGAIGSILAGIGWSLQTWGVGLILSFERR